MSDQARHWSAAARDYEREFIDPYRRDVRNPLVRVLQRIPGAKGLTAADLGCGIGPLLPLLARRFARVYAVDFAAGMLERARERCRQLANVEFLHRSLTDLGPLAGKVDVAVAVNSLIMPDIPTLEQALGQVRACLRPGGRFLGIVPAIDAVHYYTMLLQDRALAQGKPPDAARKNAAYFAEHVYYDFAFGQFRYRGLEQHFWQPFEIRYRLQRAGFTDVRLRMVRLSWDQFAHGDDLRTHPAPWDWFFSATCEPLALPKGG
jgi:SAM-dependent methyltransferase